MQIKEKLQVVISWLKVLWDKLVLFFKTFIANVPAALRWLFITLIFLITNGPGNILKFNTIILYLLIFGLVLSVRLKNDVK